MKRLSLFTVLVGLVLALSSGCASLQTRPSIERSAEIKMVVIQEKVGDGQKSGALTPEQAQMYLASLKVIQIEYTGLRGKNVTREELNSLQGRLDVLGDVINRALARTNKSKEPTISFWEGVGRSLGFLDQPNKIEGPTRGERIYILQRKIDEGINSGRMSLMDGSEFQARLDSIRSDYSRMTEGARFPTDVEKAQISSRLDSLESDINHLPQL
jgi:hypothetical protein